MPKFARPNSYTGKQSNQNWTGDTRAANTVEAVAGLSQQLYISPATLAVAIGTLVPDATTTVKGKVALATNAEAVTGTDPAKAIVPASLTARLAAPGTIGGTTPAAASFTSATITTGNITLSAAGKGIIYNPASGSGAASGTVTSNGRVGIVAFTSPSIAGGAVQTLTMANSTITGSGTDIQYSIVGATTGAALSIQSVTNSAGQSVVVVTNGTGATTQTGTITLTFNILN